MPGAWDVAKDALGLAGAVVTAIPWIRDFAARRKRGAIEQVPAEGAFRAMLERVDGRLKRWIDAPKPADLLCMIIGLAMVALSFLISLVTNLA